MSSKEVKNNIIAKLKDKIHAEIPISDVIASRIEVNPKGTDAICPFHDDSKMGSFKISDQKGIYTCFTCGETGDAIAFIQKIDKVNFIEATLRIALQFGLITDEQYHSISKEKHFTVNTITNYNKVKRVNVLTRADSEKTNEAYEVLAKCMPLTAAHRKYLNERSITNDEIDRIGYFSLTNDIKVVQRTLKIMNASFEDLHGVPGFYYSGGQLQMVSYNGIAIPIKDIYKRSQAIQIRRDKIEEGEARYVWFSSSKFNGGASVGTPVDVCFPTKNKVIKTLCICEGHFKAKMLTKKSGAYSIAIQGVNSTSELLNSVKPFVDKKVIERINIMFDADMCKNTAVKDALVKLYELLKPLNIPVFVTVWNMKDGKGIDDYIINKGKSMRILKAEQFISLYDKYVSKAYSLKAGTLLKDMPEDKLLSLWDEIIK